MNGAPERMAEWLELAWMDRYLDRKLDEAESSWFEAYALDKPALVSAIEADNNLRDGLSVTAREPRPVGGAPHGRRQLFTWFPFGMAACLSVGLAFGWLLGRPHSDDTSPFTSAPTRVVYDTWRGQAVEPVVYPGASNLMLVEVGVPHDATDVRLVSPAGTFPLTVSTDGFASFLWQSSGDSPAWGEVQYRRAGTIEKVTLSTIGLGREKTR